MGSDISDTQTCDVLDQKLVRAVAHPVRVIILELLHARVSSPVQLARRLGRSIGVTTYHCKELLKVGAIELVKTEPRRGATEHFYTAVPRAVIGHQDWRRAPVAVRAGVTNEAVRSFVRLIGAAIDADTIDRRDDTTLNWMPITVDGQGWLETAQLLRRTCDLIMEIHDRSRVRLGDGDGIPVVAGLAAFEAAPIQRAAMPDE